MDPLLQTRVPSEVFERVQRAAAEHGDTNAGWLRRIVIKEVRMIRIAAWLLHHRHADPTVHFTPGNHGVPTHFLEPLREHSALERTFILFGPDAYTPVAFEVWRKSQAFMQQADYRFLLDGSASVWGIVTVIQESTSGLLQISLSAEDLRQDFRSFREADARFRQLGASFARTKGPRGECAMLDLGSVHVSLDVAAADPNEMVLPRLVAMLERGLGLK